MRAAGHGGPTVVMAHAFVSGGATSESERDIAVGGVSVVPADVFAGVDYAALGHLHGRQQVAERVRYSGSPVAMSFSEHRHTKGALLVEVSRSPARSSRRCRRRWSARSRCSAAPSRSCSATPATPPAEHSWCQVTLTDPVRPLGAMERVQRRFPHTLELRFDPPGAQVPLRPYAARVEARAAVDVCCDFLAHVRGGRPAADEERELLAEAVGAARVARGLADDEGVAGGAASGAGAA